MKTNDDVYPSEAYSGYKWVFTPDMIPNSRKLHNVPSDALIKEYEEKLTNYTLDLLESDSNQKSLQLIMKKAGKEAAFENETLKEEFLLELGTKLVEAKFFSITKFENIVATK